MLLAALDFCFLRHVLRSHEHMQYQLPHELFHLCWFERTISWPTASNQDQNQSNNSTPSPTILIDTNERPVRDDDIVLVFGQGQATQELALQNEAFYNVGACGHQSLSGL